MKANRITVTLGASLALTLASPVPGHASPAQGEYSSFADVGFYSIEGPHGSVHATVENTGVSQEAAPRGLSNCQLVAVVTDPNGALGLGSAAVPCGTGTDVVGVQSADRINWGVGDNDTITLTLTGVEVETGATVVLASFTGQVVAS